MPAPDNQNRQMIVGNYTLHLNPTTERVHITQNTAIRLPTLCLGGAAYGIAALKGHGPRAKFVGLLALSASAAANHLVDCYSEKEKVVFDVK